MAPCFGPCRSHLLSCGGHVRILLLASLTMGIHVCLLLWGPRYPSRVQYDLSGHRFRLLAAAYDTGCCQRDQQQSAHYWEYPAQTFPGENVQLSSQGAPPA